MAKNTVSDIINKIKRRADYNISDTDLDTLIVDIINDSLKVLKQLFADYGMYDEIAGSDSFTTTADQAYVDISTTTVDFDEPISLSERTNDKQITIIPYADLIAMYPDPTANKTTTPDYAAFFDNKIYLAPTPSVSTTTLYLDYIKLISAVTSASTMPFEDRFDPLVIAMGVLELTTWRDNTNVAGMSAARARVKELTEQLITKASHNIPMNRQTASRSEGDFYFAPRRVV